MAEVASSSAAAAAPYPLPRVAIQFCTQCKWMLRAAYFAQELLSTFSTSLGEVALQPAKGGTFVVTLTHLPDGAAATSTTTLWDRKTDGGFPETKELKRRLRDVIEPNRDLGHVDRNHGKPAPAAASEVTSHLKKHPANAGKMNEGDGPGEQKSPLGDDARAAVAAAHANTGQKETAEASPPGQGLGELRRQKQEQQQQQTQATSTQAENKQACEDCA